MLLNLVVYFEIAHALHPTTDCVYVCVGWPRWVREKGGKRVTDAYCAHMNSLWHFIISHACMHSHKLITGMVKEYSV